MREVRIGTRGSALAVVQAERVAAEVRRRYSELAPVLVKIKTSGDKFAQIPLSRVGGKGLFIKEIEEALQAEQVDLAVHSMKDVPTETAAGLTIAAILEREDPSDALISRRGIKLDALPAGARIGTSSLRRQAQLLRYRPDLTVIPLRGNLDTRLGKLGSEGLDALVVATAGVNRLGRQEEITEILPAEISLPAVGQGALGLEIRATDQKMHDLVGPMSHRPSVLTIGAERAFLARLGGGCQVPIAAHAELNGDQLRLKALVAAPDGTVMVRGEREGPSILAEGIGVGLAEDLLRRGADRILQELSGISFEPPAAP
ncbi:MAG: hydroxymethylbilane synthase [Candidatus Methylomirabilales bacterium]|nr:hydroxymethylbilane synthase [candidate division NC10 bacterium]MCZ6550816.1 hydroxymethylbilane synthase [candidate division NC10 bacterium]